MEFETKTADRFRSFIERHPDCLLRSCKTGHLTASCLATSEDHSEVILTLHKKLKKWLQLGGHADGEMQLHRVAKKEAEEESGLDEFSFIDPRLFANQLGSGKDLILPFDMDIHLIPERKGEPSHLHFDIRYLLKTKETDLKISHESDDLKWFSLDEAFEICNEPSMTRQLDKLKHLCQLH